MSPCLVGVASAVPSTQQQGCFDVTLQLSRELSPGSGSGSSGGEGCNGAVHIVQVSVVSDTWAAAVPQRLTSKEFAVGFGDACSLRLRLHPSGSGGSGDSGVVTVPLHDDASSGVVPGGDDDGFVYCRRHTSGARFGYPEGEGSGVRESGTDVAAMVLSKPELTLLRLHNAHEVIKASYCVCACVCICVWCLGKRRHDLRSVILAAGHVSHCVGCLLAPFDVVLRLTVRDRTRACEGAP